MNAETNSNPASLKHQRYIPLARVACASLGATLIIWAISLPVIERLITGQPPTLRSFQQGFFGLVFGVGMIWLQSRFAVWSWAISTCNALAMVIMFVTLVTAFVAGVSSIATSLMVFAPFATLATWLALPQSGSQVPPLSDEKIAGTDAVDSAANEAQQSGAASDAAGLPRLTRSKATAPNPQTQTAAAEETCSSGSFE